MPRFTWEKQTSMCRTWTPLLVTVTKTMFHFWPVISALLVFTSAMTSSTRGASAGFFVSVNPSWHRRKRILPDLPMKSNWRFRPHTTSWKELSKCGTYLKNYWPCARESNRVLHQQLVRGEALTSQADLATAQELDARTLLLQSQLDYTQANDEIIHAMGQTPE